MRLTKENPHVKLSTMNTMTKEDLLAAIHSPDVLEAGMDLDKHTLIVFLNYELNRNPDNAKIKVNLPEEFNWHKAELFNNKKEMKP